MNSEPQKDFENKQFYRISSEFLDSIIKQDKIILWNYSKSSILFEGTPEKFGEFLIEKIINTPLGKITNSIGEDIGYFVNNKNNPQLSGIKLPMFGQEESTMVGMNILNRIKPEDKNISESIEIKQEGIDNYLYDLSLYLGEFSGNIHKFSIDEDGKIIIPEEKEEKLFGDNGVNYKTKIQSFFKQDEKNINQIKNIKNDINTKDCISLLGTIIITYNSSDGIPSVIAENNSKDRGFFKTPSRDNPAFIGIDLNNKKRDDGVIPTITLQHELRHFLTYIGDNIIKENENVGLNYVVRNLKDYGNFRSKKELISSDKKTLDLIYGREFNSGSSDEIEAYSNQLGYLDELHSSFVQGKKGRLNIDSKVYIPGKIGTHKEIIGENKIDQENLENLIILLQKINCITYLVEEIFHEKEFEKNMSHPLQKNRCIIIDEEFEKTKKVFNHLIEITGTNIGVARNINQAYRLVQKFWDEYILLLMPNKYIKEIEFFHEKYYN
ncbi:MAG: hypothetical protein PHZ26_00725 [Candidatus Gracilibacteria bacterium]|nr:hypothetical protein [Candidatus Gracilibacteria bacterium]MDD2908260.1 hypothetical protein [Candidatus Gracilibacteria bacterium]